MIGAGKSTVEIVIAAKDRTRAAFAKVNTQMKAMGGASGRLNSAMGSLKGGLSNVSSSLGSFGAALGPIGIAVAGAAVVMATLGGAAIKASLEFEKAVATIRVGTGATGEALAGLEGSFKTVFTAVPTTAANAATAIADLNTRLGLSGEPLEALATQFLNLSRITGTDISSAISSATRVMHDFDVAASEQGSSLDYLFKVSQSTGIGMTQLSSSMTQYGSVMRQMGFDINESAALLGKFEKEGVNLQLVLGSLRMGLANFAKAGEEPVEALQRVITEIQGMGSVADANMKAIEVFGSRAGPDMAAAIREGRFSIDELMATLEASGETINKAAEDALTFGDKWTLFKNKTMEAIAPIGDVLTNVLGNAIEGLSANFSRLQAVIGPVMSIFKTFFDAINSAISSALAPLTERLESLQQKFKEGSDKLTIFSDIFTIVAAAAKWLGEAIGTLVSMALTPLVAKLKEGMDMLGAFYDKLGPIKGALEWLGESVHNVAESFRETTPPIKEVEEALEALNNTEPKAPQAIAAAWALAIKSFQEGTGTYKEAIDGIEEKIKTLTEEWMTATDERKAAIEKEVELLRSEGDSLEELKKTAEDTLSSTAKETEKATEKMEEFTVAIGDTTVSFKGAAAEVVKNADAYEKLQKSAQTLIDLDWAVFTEFEASLPNIESGILDMESSFVGLKDILEENIGSLENVKESVMDISEIAAPFLEAGFLKGIESIGSFASTLKDAGSAINTFGSLQEVSIGGCINFSMHVHDMVSALEVLEDQMEDLVPAFGEMDSLITDIADAFLYGAGKSEVFESSFEKMVGHAHTLAEKGGMAFADFSDIIDEALSTEKIGIIENYWHIVGSSTSAAIDKSYQSMVRWVKEVGGASAKLSIREYYDLMKMSSEEQTKWLENFLHSSSVITFQMNKQTNALGAQTGQLSKITEALQPYLEFMRTLNELAALSTLSTAELNSGLNSINDTLINLSKSLESFDLRPVMETLFGTKTAKGDFLGGTATDFMNTMEYFATPFSNMITYVERLTSSILSLVSSFKALSNISDSVLADQTKLKEVFEGITTVMTNFSTEMGGTEGFAQKFVEGMKEMLKSAEPLISYFQDNNAAIVQFNKSLDLFVTTITNVVSNIQELSTSLKTAADMVIVSSKDIEEALALIPAQLGEIAVFLGTDIWKDIVNGLSAVDFSWNLYAKTVEESMKPFNSAVDTFSTLISKILGLSTALKEMRDMTVLSVRDIDEALKNIPIFLDRFVDALALNMGEIKRTLKDLDREWELHTDEMKDTLPAYEDSTEKIGNLIGSLLSLSSTLKQLAEMGTISSKTFDTGFLSLIKSISNFAGSLSKNVDGLISSLQSLRTVWVDNEAVLFPLIRDFGIITDNLWGVAHNANRMSEEFRELMKNSVILKIGFKSLIKFINQVVKATKEFYTPEAAAELSTFIKDVGKVILSFYNLKMMLNGVMDKIKTAIGNAVDNIEGKIKSIGTLTFVMYNSGVNLMQSLINGIAASIPALSEQMKSVAGVIEGHLATYSPARLGPLRYIEEWPRNLIQTYSSGLEAEMHTLNSSFSALAPGMMAAPTAGGNRNVNFYVTQHISDRDTADYANQNLERLMHKHAVM